MGGMSRLSDEISPNEVSLAICTAREPGTLKRGRKKGLKAKGTKKKSGWKLLKGKVRPLKKKKRAAKKKMGAVVKFKKGGKAASRKRAARRLAKMLDQENIEAIPREIRAAADSAEATPAPTEPEIVPTPLAQLRRSRAAMLSYDKAWAEFRSIIYSALRTTDPDT